MTKLIYTFLLLGIIFGCSKNETASVTPNSGSQSPITIDFNNYKILKPTTFKNIVDDPNRPDYIIKETLSIQDALTIEPGVVIQFTYLQGITLGETGAIIAKGTSSAHIKFIGEKAIKGQWGGIRYYGSLDPRNEFNYVDFFYGGSSITNQAMLFVGDGIEKGKTSTIKITNCLFKGSAQYGLIIEGGLSTFSNNTFQENGLAPILVHRNYVHLLDEQSKYSGNNGMDAIEIPYKIENDEESLQPFTEKEVTWKAPIDGTKYLISGDLPIKFGLRINPGAKLDFKPACGLIITRDGYLSAKGTSSQKIKFTGTAQVAGSWKGIWIESNNVNNEIAFAEITHCGQKPQSFGYNYLTTTNVGAIMLNGQKPQYYQDYGARLKLSNSTIAQSSSYGLVIGQNAICQRNTPDDNIFSGCQSGNIKAE